MAGCVCRRTLHDALITPEPPVIVDHPVVSVLMKSSRAVFFRQTMLCLTLVAPFAYIISTDAIAQTQPPSGGQLLRQLTLPPAPPPADKPALSVEQNDKGRAGDTTPIPVRQIRITGNTFLPTSQL